MFVFSSRKFCLKVTLDHNFVIGSYGPLVSSSFNIGTKNALPLSFQNTQKHTYSLSPFVSFSYAYLHKHTCTHTHNTHTHNRTHAHFQSTTFVFGCDHFWRWLSFHFRPNDKQFRDYLRWNSKSLTKHIFICFSLYTFRQLKTKKNYFWMTKLFLFGVN